MSCPAYQRLRLITAKYNRYLYTTSYENNFQKKQVNNNYGQPLCEKTVSWLSCTKSAPRLRFGLSRIPEGPFQAQVSLAPSFSQGNEVYGYAAVPLPNGSCPEGLVRARLFEAQPESVMEPLPSNFINREGNLNGQVVGVEGAPVPDFTVSRQKSEMPCDGRGSCRNAEFMPPEIVQEVPYSALDPVVCVIPQEALGGLKARR
jgi:hypothetical protein